MKSKALIYYVGKVCTIFTTPMNQAYKDMEKQIFGYFVGLVESIDELGVQMTNTMTGRKNFYFFPNILSIHEEEVLDPSNPKHAKIIEEMEALEKKAAEIPPPAPKQAPPVLEDLHQAEVNDSPFVDIKAIQSLAQRAKQQNLKAKETVRN